MDIKKIVITALVTILIIYIVSLIVLLLSSSGPSNYLQAFNPLYQHETWIFVFVWSMGNWGYLVMVILWLILFTAIYQIIDKSFFDD